MIQAVILDTGVLGLATKPRRSADAIAIGRWVQDLDIVGVKVYVPEITDYEVRRELVRAGTTAGIARLNAFNTIYPDRYLPLTTVAMRQAADLWAIARNRGYATAPPQALDGDVIVAAQALVVGLPTSDCIVATDNVRHLSRYVPAAEWTNINP